MRPFASENFLAFLLETIEFEERTGSWMLEAGVTPWDIRAQGRTGRHQGSPMHWEAP